MKPIFILAMVAIGATLVGAGALNNEITLTLQNFGVGSADIVSPITAANIDYTIDAVPVDLGGTQGPVLKNLITNCEFSSEQDILGDHTIICKLTDENHNVVAEGRVTSIVNYVAGSTVTIPINVFAFEYSNEVTNIHDTTLIVMEGLVPAS